MNKFFALALFFCSMPAPAKKLTAPKLIPPLLVAKAKLPYLALKITPIIPIEQCWSKSLSSFINESLSGPLKRRKGRVFQVSSRSSFNAYKKLSPPSILVTSAGNKNDLGLSVHPDKARASKDFNAIIVGSLHPDGLRSDFSSQGRAVHIMAPSDYSLTSAYDDGKYFPFGGTSGAAPLVTGSLAGFEWLSGYHPTPEEAKILLKKTAIPTLHSAFENPRKNGVGMVNAYKLGMVGKFLKGKCGRNVDCFKKLIRGQAAYWFPEDAGLDHAIRQAFPQCSDQCRKSQLKNKNESCPSKAQVFKRLRKAAFLNPSKSALWKKLACVYNQNGFKESGKAFLNIYRATLKTPGGDDLATDCQFDSDCRLVPCNADFIAKEAKNPISHGMLKRRYVDLLSPPWQWQPSKIFYYPVTHRRERKFFIKSARSAKNCVIMRRFAEDVLIRSSKQRLIIAAV